MSAELSDDLSDLVAIYVDRYRPVLLSSTGALTGTLFVGQTGRPKSSRELSKQLAAFVKRELGIIVHAHLFRHLAAFIYLRENPGDYETVRQMLGHKQIATTINSYAGTDAEGAFAQYGKLLAAKALATVNMSERDSDGH